jgi:heme-degrading monooxygenase HmoA
MYARVWRAGILPGKVEEYTAAVRAVVPILRQQAGFRSLVVLRGGPGDRLESTVISVWETLVALRDSETPEFERAVALVLSFCERHPSMREEEVLIDEFASSRQGAAIDSDDTITKF